MSLKKTSRYGHGTLSELNITPLLDLVFVLLVIFIITTPQMMNNLEMTLPSGKPPPVQDEPKPKIHRILLDANGRSFLDNQVFALPALKERLQQLKAADADLRVVVKADDEADYQGMVNVLDTLQQLDITKVGLATESSAAN
ncbi:MAG TPA: biopolymer transporter ExbD [Verrucomicrobiae bacterium]|nr:biopolymer transporter ExbD [Verrucomicrobiae bacterium]